MSFNDAENSLSSGNVARLFLFSAGTNQWAYTTADQAITYDSVTYQSTQISDGGIRQSGQSNADTFEVEAPYDLAVAQFYRGIPPSYEINLTVRDYQVDEAAARVVWMGSIYSVNFMLNRCTIRCESLGASMDANGLRLGWSRNCNRVLYNCGVDKDDFAVIGTITAVGSSSIDADEFDVSEDGYFNGGFVQWSLAGGVIERRTIESHAAGNLILFGGSDGIEVDDSVTAYPGCPRIIAVCNSRFSNAANYGGIPSMPGRSPFGGDPIF